MQSFLWNWFLQSITPRASRSRAVFKDCLCDRSWEQGTPHRFNNLLAEFWSIRDAELGRWERTVLAERLQITSALLPGDAVEEKCIRAVVYIKMQKINESEMFWDFLLVHRSDFISGSLLFLWYSSAFHCTSRNTQQPTVIQPALLELFHTCLLWHF